jgi:hypothetical protein
MQLGETMKFQTLTALSFLFYLAAPASFAATDHSGGATAHAEPTSRSLLLTVTTGVSGGHAIQSSSLGLLKVNGIEATGIGKTAGNLVGNAQNAAQGSAQEAVHAAANAEPGTLAMLLTGLGVMGSIVRRRRLAKKAA